MASEVQEMIRLRGYMAASQSLKGWITGARALALLTGAADAGVLNVLREPYDPAKVAAATGMDLPTVGDLCLALEAHGIARREGEGYRLTFDTIQRSQFFFPTPSRQIVLRAMYRALKPGGYLFMPWIGCISDDTAPSRRAVLGLGLRVMRSRGFFLPYLMDLLGDTSARRTRERRFGALLKLIFTRWGVPVRTIGDLRSEVEDAGFRVLRVIRLTASEFNFTRGFLLASREES